MIEPIGHNGAIPLREARDLADDLAGHGEARAAAIIRSLCLTYEQSRRTNSALHKDNMALRAAANLN